MQDGNRLIDDLPIEIANWLSTNIFDKTGALVYIKDGDLVQEYPCKNFKRSYVGLTKRSIEMLHLPQIRRLWGRVVENMTDISTAKYVHIQNRITHYHRYKPDLTKHIDMNRYEEDVSFFLSLIRHLCSHKMEDEEWLLHYSAFLIQKQTYEERTERILILYSLQQGVGKSVFCHILRTILNGSSIHSSVLLNKFDAYRLGLKNLILLEEGEVLGIEHYTILKSLVTSHTVETTVKHEMYDQQLPCSCEVIITTNKVPTIFRLGTNRREVLIECTISPKKEFFNREQLERKSFYAHIDQYLKTIQCNTNFVQTYIQKEPLEMDCSNNDIYNFIRDLLCSKLIPIYDDTLGGSDYRMTEWIEEETDTGLTPHQLFRLFCLYQTYMNSKIDYRYRLFIEECKRILATSLSISDQNRIIFKEYRQANDHYKSSFIRFNIYRKNIKPKTFKQWLLYL